MVTKILHSITQKPNLISYFLIIKYFLNINKNSYFNDLIIEHGLVFADFVQPHILKSFANKIFTFGEYRRDIILNYTNKNVFCIGPYIAYAESLLNESELQNLKNKWGNCLLVFPTHSIPDLKATFDKNLFCNEIDRIGINYDKRLKKMLLEEYQKPSEVNDVMLNQFEEESGINFPIEYKIFY